jgi:hypothetical protein
VIKIDAKGGTISVPKPMPLEAMPEAKPRRRANHGGTALTASESEALLEPARLDRLTHQIAVEGTGMTLAELKPDSRAPAEAIARWRLAAARYHAQRYPR